MLPFLPALLLLILNGPAGLDRMAHDGRLPEALRALNDRIQVEGISASGAKLEQEIALASLLASHGDPDLSQALAELIFWAGLTESTEQAIEAPIEIELESPQLPCGPPAGTLRDGFTRATRSRDGPVAR